MAVKTRREFIRTTSKVALGIGVSMVTIPILQNASEAGMFRIEPIPGRQYPDGFLLYIQQARFNSVTEAVESVFDSRLAYKVVSA